MKYKSALNDSLKMKKLNWAKELFVGFVLILAFTLFTFNFTKVSAVEEANVGVTITGTMFDKDGTGGIEEGEKNFKSIDLTTTNGDSLTFIQGNGKDSETVIKFTITNFPKDISAFMIVESEYTDSSSTTDADRWGKEVVKDPVSGLSSYQWVASSKNQTINDITGSVEIVEGGDGKLTATITYRLRNGDYGMSFFRIFFYKENVFETTIVDGNLVVNGNERNPFSTKAVYYVISQPIDMVEQGATCIPTASNLCVEKNETIFVAYDTTASTSRISKTLKIVIPTTVAYNFKVHQITTETFGNNFKVGNYQDVVDNSTVYAINYFDEAANGDVTPATTVTASTKTYMYTNFKDPISGSDSKARTEFFYNDDNDGNYTYFLNNYFAANEIDCIETKVDSIGAYVYYIKDIFGNIKEVKQNVANVKNRAIIVEIQKGNSTDKGYGANETYTNESEKVSLKMTTETHFEYGICLNEKCSDIIDLGADQVALVRYWRVNVKIENDIDIDAYDAVKNTGNNYGAETNRSGDSIYLYCNASLSQNVNCSGVTIQEYYAEMKNLESGFGVAGFGVDGDAANVFSMYVGVNGRYRFYVEDKFGNNTWGIGGDLLQEEYRNPRVEIYGIDKKAPEITFGHETINAATTLKSFEINSYEYYKALGITGDENAERSYEYDGRVDVQTETAKIIDEKIYYPYNRDGGRNIDKAFTDADAITLSKVIVKEYANYYDTTKADSLFSTYLGATNLYSVEGFDNSIATILTNLKNNSNGLKLVNGNFVFKEINYYHFDGASTVCEQIQDLGTDYAGYTNKLDCVNYYLDHGVDFIVEFKAEDIVGNIGSARIYVDVIDTTVSGFRLHYTTGEGGTEVVDQTKLVKGSNIGTKCRMEIGQEIGNGKNQTIVNILNCYNIDLNNTLSADNKYNFEDNVYDAAVKDGLQFANTINDISHVKLYFESDFLDANNEVQWIDLSSSTFVPNKTGYYDVKIVITDEAGNTLTLLVSYYVDKKIVLIEPKANEKYYGSDDVTFEYCVYIYDDSGTNSEIRFSENPYANDGEIFVEAYCTTNGEGSVDDKKKVFQLNTNSDFKGALSRLESSWYNKEKEIYADEDETIGVENNYVGLYEIILGTLNIVLNDDPTQQDDDYIVKIHPFYRNDENRLDGSDNSINSTNIFTDDDNLAESNVKFTIKQVVIQVTASGASKYYGSKDVGSDKYNNDSSNDYLNGIASVTGLMNDIADGGQYKDTSSVILGVLRRQIGEDVGLYKICNYRGKTNNDNKLETINNMYLNCEDTINMSDTVVFSDPATYEYNNGILVLNDDYIKSRALYIETNKTASGKTMNVTTDARNNNFANYVIDYIGANYIIDSIDLVIQAAPGQRREYNHNDVPEPNPWEIILYGLKEFARTQDNTFNGYTKNSDVYTSGDNDSSDVALLPANTSETRDSWKLVHTDTNTGEEVVLTGLKTNETYSLLRNTDANSIAGSAKLYREDGNNGGWYLYKSLAKDANVGVSASTTELSEIAVITNGNKHCTYDETGHIITGVDGQTSYCKNYDLIFNPYYTNSDGYTYQTKTEDHEATSQIVTGTTSKDVYMDFVYQSNGEACIDSDVYETCYDENDEEKIYKISFQIYRREIILEFNSALETITYPENWNIQYGKRYNFYKTNLFDRIKNEHQPEGYIFLCYQDKDSMVKADLNDNGGNGGCTNNPNYGLTAGDSWENVGLTFKMHDLVSGQTNGYYADSDKAIPAGAYYIYSDINEGQKRNYKYEYLGGTLTIKSLPVQVVITSYTKEYGDKYYSGYGTNNQYNSFASFADSCLSDYDFLKGATTLVDTRCSNTATDFENSEKNIYGFRVEGLDFKDTIKDNFAGRPLRSRNGSNEHDEYGLQEKAGTHTISKGTVSTIQYNLFVVDNACTVDDYNTDSSSCVVLKNVNINNYVIEEETREYKFNLVGEEDPIVSTMTFTVPLTINGYVYITPAKLTITVAPNQAKMYGCAYNTYKTKSDIDTLLGEYDYDDGYGSNCVETDGDYYDLGYKYTVSGDKDYQIARNGFNYTSSDSYEVIGTSRPTILAYGVKSSALNAGTLYRIPWAEYFSGEGGSAQGIKMSSYVTASISAQKGISKTYQAQNVGKYVITLGDVDATENLSGGALYNNACDVNNNPGSGTAYSFACKNYVIDYYGTNVFELKTDNSNADDEQAQKYLTELGAFPEELTFEIVKRKVYVYTNYDQKIYGEADMYSNPPSNEAIFMCGDHNMDTFINDDDYVEVNGTKINKDVYYGFCSQAQVDANTDTDANTSSLINYGLTRYYTKYNSLAKAPWNALGDRDDVQSDVLSGKISRKGMGGATPTTDDIRGYYDYAYQTHGGTVALTNSYGDLNYTVNFYNESGDAVQVDGTTTTTYNGEEKEVKYEIVFRQIKVAFVSFSKIYGDEDDVADYNILVCSPNENFDFENMLCVDKEGVVRDDHGLSDNHQNIYMNSGILNQESFKEEFIVRFVRVLGENVSCETVIDKSSNVGVRLENGFFFGDGSNEDGNEFTKTLTCKTITLKKEDNSTYDKTVYETLAYIDQSDNAKPGYNYQISYETGYVNITPRKIIITPDDNQGFVYGNYHDVLIPTITYKDSVDSTSGANATYGLVHGSGEDGVCLRNINYYNNDLDNIKNKENGDCFNVNDRIDEYDSKTNKSTSSYNNALVDYDKGLNGLTVKNFVFGDNYSSETDEGRSALNRVISNTKSRYNRNVGIYTITLGDLKDQTGNYDIKLDDSKEYKYTISKANTTVTPDAKSSETTINGTSQDGQYKIYGERDKELTFSVKTSYTVASNYFAKYNSNIISVESGGTVVLLNALKRYVQNGNNFVEDAAGTYIELKYGDVVLLDGFAYGENGGTATNLNYGKSQVPTKNGNEDISVSQALPQSSGVEIRFYDKFGANLPAGLGLNNGLLSYGSTSRILLGYLYVENYAQGAGTYNIVSGMYAAVNQWGNQNYNLNVIETIKYTIIPRPIGVDVENIEKTYGQSTDVISCDGDSVECALEANVLKGSNKYLKNNYTITSFAGDTDITSIINNYTVDGVSYNNGTLYLQNGGYATGIGTASVINGITYYYTASGSMDDGYTSDLGVYVGRDEKNINADNCLYNGDRYGLCEDVGVYHLRLYGYSTTIDNITKDNYANLMRAKATYTLDSTISKYYYNEYFGYNPNYFVVVIDSNGSVITSNNIFATNHQSTTREAAEGSKEYDKMLKPTATLTIKQKEVAIAVNTKYFSEGGEIYYVSQNTQAPSLPTIDNEIDLNYNLFKGIGVTANRKDAVYGNSSYGKVVWGTQPTPVRTGDKLVGGVAYCNKIINDYDSIWSSGITTSYCDSELVTETSKVLTNKTGFVPIVRNDLVITHANGTTGSNLYEVTNYSVTFYPGALRIEEDGKRPVVDVNRSDIYIEASAVGDYLYECVALKGTTTYSDCTITGLANGISILGKTELVEGEPILDWLDDVSNKALIIRGEAATNGVLPTYPNCAQGEGECTTSYYLERMYGKLKTDFEGIAYNSPKAWNKDAFPFVIENTDEIKNEGPNSIQQMINTLVSWFGVTAYDEGEFRNNQKLDKHFNKYWYIIIEDVGTNGTFHSSKVGNYKVHFYVMDNAGNVSDGNMYDQNGALQTGSNNVGTLHIVDTTKPVVGTINFYNGKVSCVTGIDGKGAIDCSDENNWLVAEDTYIHVSTLLRYNNSGEPAENGAYVDVGDGGLTKYDEIQKYSKTSGGYEKDDYGRYVKIEKGKKATALKTYGWSNSANGIYMTITGGSDNSYTETNIVPNKTDYYSQWDHYYSRDNGITWHLYNRERDGRSSDGNTTIVALNAEGSREILIKAVDNGVKLDSISTAIEASYIIKTYKDNTTNTYIGTEYGTKTYYEFSDSTGTQGGWNLSDASSNDEIMANKLSKLLYGEDSDETGYKYYKDRRIAYLDRTSPTVTLFGEKMYVHEYGCDTLCTVGYKEEYAKANDKANNSTKETAASAITAANPFGFSLVHSEFINNKMHALGENVTIWTNYHDGLSEALSTTATTSSGLGNDSYLMNGVNGETDIRSIGALNRTYIIYSFDESDNMSKADLSEKIPTHTNQDAQDYKDAENNISSIIKNPTTYVEDYSYTIVYIVYDKAGNESVYLSRGVLYVDLVPDIGIVTPQEPGIANVVNQIDDTTYSLTVEQGENVEDVLSSIQLMADDKKQFLTQTIYYNGELVVNDKKYKEDMYGLFTTANPGVYEITYNLRYMHYNKNGESELIESTPIKLTITIEETPPIVSNEKVNNYSYIILLVGALIASLAVCYFNLVSKKRK